MAIWRGTDDLSTTSNLHRNNYTTSKMTSTEKTHTVATKAYKNMDFLNSESARNIRIMCEYEVRPLLHRSIYVHYTSYGQ